MIILGIIIVVVGFTVIMIGTAFALGRCRSTECRAN